MKLKWMVLCGIWLLAAQASAEDAVVIDAQTLQSLGQPTDAAASAPQAVNTPAEQTSGTAAGEVQVPAAAASEPDAAPPAGEQNANETTATQAEAIRERVMHGGKMSARQQMAVSRIQEGEQNSKSGAAFLAENRNVPGVVTLPSGVQYKVLRPGNGRKPTENSLVLCRYHGKLLDGREFESTGTKGPMYFYVSSFLPGVKQALVLMPAGSKWQIVVPPQLGYRELGNRLVGPNATLIYEMELIAIK